MILLALLTIAASLYVIKLLRPNKGLKRLTVLVIFIIIYELAVLINGINWINNYRWIIEGGAVADTIVSIPNFVLLCAAYLLFFEMAYMYYLTSLQVEESVASTAEM